MLKKKNVFKDFTFVIFVLGLSLWIFFTVTNFISQTKEIEFDSLKANIIAVTENNKNTILYTLDEYFADLHQKASTIVEFGEYNHHSQQALFENLVRTQFAYLSVVFLDGETVLSDGTYGKVIDPNIINSMAEHKEFITEIYYDEKLQESAIALFTPIVNKKNIIDAYLCAVITTKQLVEIYQSILFVHAGNFHIIDGRGKHFANELGTDPFFSQSEKTADGKMHYPALEELAIAHDAENNLYEIEYSDFPDFKLNGAAYMHYVPLGINGWIINSVMPKEFIESKTRLHQRNAFTMLFNNSIILLLAFWYIYATKKKEYENNHLIGESLKILAEHTGKIILEWNIVDNSVIAHSDFSSTLPPDLNFELSNPTEFRNSLLHPDDVAKLDEILKDFIEGKDIEPIDVRSKNSLNEYIWIRISLVMIRNKHGAAKKAFLIIEDIDEEVKKSNQLLNRAQNDSLTNLYNKITTEELIIEALKDPRNHPAALFILDLDNFKDINDNFGHLYGDNVLKDVANKIKQQFRTNDIVGRIGGDEFFIFMKHIHSVKQIETKARDLVEQLVITYSEKGIDVTITASIGIALTDTCGADFKSLYQAADKSLYEVKKSEKNDFKICSSETLGRSK